ncbi:hypothetical protein DBT_2003 [Dissulfuribacter thermophilus]|uniref:Uncharacterized protein n=1 Tax=Dissulfuribacter thermophilus TaxID=1156395 RepID=A0A1B9F430_9BACT|nr:hypothetical protein [Dissulfuribacter thermophilus]OCC14688.1 hypothetical protein DBT_2003 [Dissulfuribacter thermophilus]
MKKVLGTLAVFFVFMAFLVPDTAHSIPTKLTIRVKAKDAKFIGSSMGGAFVLVKDVMTGEVLAKGFTKGGTGNTKLLMKTPIARGVKIGEKAAKFDAILDIDEPKKVEIIAQAPYAQPQAMQKVSVTTWVIPGKDITGDGIILELPGYVVDILNPSAHTMIKGAAKIKLTASVTPMCGCPVSPKTFWHPDAIEVAAIVKKNNKIVDTIPMKFSGKTNIFEADLDLTQKGAYTITVYAFDKETGNTGVDMTSVIILKK